MTVALIKLASLGPDSGRVGRAIGVFPYMLIRENSDCYAVWVNEVQMVSIFAQDNYLAKGTKLSPGLKNTTFIFCLPPLYKYYWGGRRARSHGVQRRIQGAKTPPCPQSPRNWHKIDISLNITRKESNFY